MLLECFGQGAIAEFQLPRSIDPHPGALGSSSSVVGSPETIRQQQVAMETHAQGSMARAPRKGGTGGEHERFLVPVGILLTVPASEQVHRDPAWIDDNAGVDDVEE